MVTGSNPLNLTGGGIARISAAGVGSYVLAATAAGDSNITRAALGSAPALSNDGSTLYVAVNNTNQYDACLLGLDSTTLTTTKYKVFLTDPRNGNNAGVIDQSTASPMVGPDGTVFFGVFGNPYNGSRGFLLHFSANLTQEFTPGAFGWDDTPSVIPTTMVPSYQGTSSYLILSKYNNYVAAETGSEGGDGVNKIAILDPFATEIDPHNDGNPNLLVMAEVETIVSPTPDTQYTNAGYPNAVQQGMVYHNGTVVDPYTDSVFINNEDGHAYRWNLGSNSLTQSIQITDGIGEPYTPTAIGPDGTIYAINGGTLFALGGLPFSKFVVNVQGGNTVVAGQSFLFTVASGRPVGQSGQQLQRSLEHHHHRRPHRSPGQLSHPGDLVRQRFRLLPGKPENGRYLHAHRHGRVIHRDERHHHRDARERFLFQGFRSSHRNHRQPDERDRHRPRPIWQHRHRLQRFCHPHQ